MTGTDPRRRGREWITLGHGIRSEAAALPRLIADLRAWQRVLPSSAVFGGITAAAAHGLWLPAAASALPTFAAAGTKEGEAMPARSQLVVARHPASPPYVLMEGVRVQPVAEAILESARWLSVLDTVTLVDSALHARQTSRGRLDAIARQRRRGNRMLRYALPFADGRSESPWETYLRMLHVVGGIDVTPQVDLWRHIGRPSRAG